MNGVFPVEFCPLMRTIGFASKSDGRISGETRTSYPLGARRGASRRRKPATRLRNGVHLVTTSAFTVFRTSTLAVVLGLRIFDNKVQLTYIYHGIFRALLVIFRNMKFLVP